MSAFIAPSLHISNSQRQNTTDDRPHEKQRDGGTNLNIEDTTSLAVTAQKSTKSWRFRLAFFGVQIIAFVYALDANALAVAVPSVAAQLDGTTLQSFWASLSYLLAVVITQPFYVATSSEFGRKPLLMGALAYFAIGSIVFGLSHNMGSVIAGRVIQGLGGGGLNILGSIIVSDMTTLKERPLYLGLLALPVAAGTVASQ
ncbi:hypothetical protein N0V82_009088 [Gnomoniopsis sp. IMI 355080]|nr:hypothetical protein N0V82_009088 [Gnomoniopsis sp. IMI 355080]